MIALKIWFFKKSEKDSIIFNIQKISKAVIHFSKDLYEINVHSILVKLILTLAKSLRSVPVSPVKRTTFFPNTAPNFWDQSA